ncbi:tail fiber assembly protein [Pseudomonas sp. PE-S1G-1]|uniref:tail fiber assembly protein n=1 Tax=Pseudomonas sp. PE-S1G-1 TaxID=1986995 RepID=UPI000B3FFA9A|nr:tail fiber assembly protein [Pseudomonas sp. PE-S1G-1]
MNDLELSVPSPDEVKLLEWAAVRTRRNQLLAGTDYTQTADSALAEAQRAEVAVYRQALRDIPESGPDPFTIAWPEKPEFLK